MAKKIIPPPVSKTAAPIKAKAATTPVRNTALPKAAPVIPAATPRKQITHEMIAKRAFEIWASGKGGSEVENWQRAERDLLGL